MSRYWEDIKRHLVYSLSPQFGSDEEALSNILESLLNGNSQAWILIKGKDVYAMSITTFGIEEATKTKNLLIYSLSGYKYVPEDLWKKAFSTLIAFARNNDCEKIVAYSSVSVVISIAKKLGANTDISLLVWEV